MENKIIKNEQKNDDVMILPIELPTE